MWCVVWSGFKSHVLSVSLVSTACSRKSFPLHSKVARFLSEGTLTWRVATCRGPARGYTCVSFNASGPKCMLKSRHQLWNWLGLGAKSTFAEGWALQMDFIFTSPIICTFSKVLTVAVMLIPRLLPRMALEAPNTKLYLRPCHSLAGVFSFLG